MPDSTLSRRSAALLRLLLRKTHKFHTETAEEPKKRYDFILRHESIVIAPKIRGPWQPRYPVRSNKGKRRVPTLVAPSARRL